jgi:hypothetical protein
LAPESANSWSRLRQSPVAQFFLAFLFIGLPFLLANIVSKLLLVAPLWKEARNPFKTAVLLAAYCLFVRVVERRPVFEFGLRGALKELGLGFALGAVLIATVVALLALMGWYRFDGVASVSGMFRMLYLHAFVAVLEEVLFRGIVFRLLEKILGSWWALALSTLLFGAAHLANPGASALTLSCLGVFSVAVSLAFLATRRLWLCIGLHWAWNFAQGGLFSLPVSGLSLWPGLLAAGTSGPAWATGAGFGLEASALTLALTGLLCAWLARVAKKRDYVRRLPIRGSLATHG